MSYYLKILLTFLGDVNQFKLRGFFREKYFEACQIHLCRIVDPIADPATFYPFWKKDEERKIFTRV